MAIKYKWLYEKLIDEIESDMKKGISMLPSEESLCVKYGLSRQTVRQALSLLEKNGLIERIKGSGTYITGLYADPNANRIALLLYQDQEYLYPALIYDLQSRLTQKGYTCEVFTTGGSFQQERNALLEIQKQKEFRGIVVEPCKSALPNPNLDLYRNLLQNDVKILFLRSDYHSLNCPCIKEDDYNGSRLLTSYLLSHGHSSIAGIFRLDDSQGITRFQGFMDTMRAANISVPDEHFTWFHTEDVNHRIKSHNTHFLSDFAGHLLPSCSAVICHNDEVAYLLSIELRALGYQLPEDCTIVSFDHSYLSSQENGPFLSLSHHPHELADATAEALLNLCKGLPATSRSIPWKMPFF